MPLVGFAEETIRLINYSVIENLMVAVSDLDPMHSSCMPVSLPPICRNQDL